MSPSLEHLLHWIDVASQKSCSELAQKKLAAQV